MPAASRVQLVPPAGWDEARLVEAVRTLPTGGAALRPGDEVGGLVVVRVEPAPGATLQAETEVEVLPQARRADAPVVELSILLDVSESMGAPWDAKHSRLQAARVAIESFLEAPNPAVASVVIHQYAKRVERVGGPARPSLVKLGPEPAARGGSATATAIDEALAELAARATAARSQVVILLTDGVGEVSELLAAAGRAGRLLVPIHSLVFAPEVDHVFEDIAKASGGSVQRAGYPLVIEFVHEPAGG